MASSEVTKLLKNIKENLNDSTNYATVAAALNSVEIASEFFCRPVAGKYAVIVPGDAEDERTFVSAVAWWQPVQIYVAGRQMFDPSREKSTVGDSAKDGLDTTAKDVRQALDRPSPYNDRKPSGSGYTAQKSVKNVRYEGLSYPSEEDRSSYISTEGDYEDAVMTQIVIVNLSYYIIDTRSA